MPLDVDLWSSTEFFEYADELCAALSRQGVPATQRYLVSKRDYRNVTGCLSRAWMRGRTYVGYPLMVAADFAFRQRPAVSIVTTNTFFAPWLATRLAHGSRRVIHLVYDLFPDALTTAGLLKPHSLATGVIHRITADTFQRAAANVFLGPRLLEHAIAQYGAVPRAEVIPVGAAAGPFVATRPAPRPPGTPVSIVYSGNLGRMHDTATFVNAWSLPTTERLPATAEPIVVRFHATGARLAELRAGLGLAAGEHVVRSRAGLTVEFAGRAADADWCRMMLAADIGLVTMAPGAEAVVMPSKTYSAMVAGQAILAICPLESDLADLVLKHDCGWVVVPESHASQATVPSRYAEHVFLGAVGLRKALASIASNPSAVLHKRINAYDAGHAFYSSDHIAQCWLDVVRRVGMQ